MKRFLDYNKKLKDRARELRRNMTRPEQKIWYDFLRKLEIKHSAKCKSSSVLLDKEEVATENRDDILIPFIKGEVSDSEQGDCTQDKATSVKVLRQRVIGNFIVDFYLPAYKIVIEIDGESHFTNQAKQYDRERSEYLQGEGIRIIRFTNDEVMNEFEGVCRNVLEELN